jgi:hypothetical protein
MNRPASLVAGIFLILIALAQLCRVIFKIDISAAGIEIPFWPSAVAFIFLISLAAWLLTERRK